MAERCEISTDDPRLAECKDEIADARDSFARVNAVRALNMLDNLEDFVDRVLTDEDKIKAVEVQRKITRAMSDLKDFVLKKEGSLVFVSVNGAGMEFPITSELMGFSVEPNSDLKPVSEIVTDSANILVLRDSLESILVNSGIVAASDAESRRITSPKVQNMMRARNGGASVKRVESSSVDALGRKVGEDVVNITTGALYRVYSEIQAYLVQIKVLGLLADYLKEKEDAVRKPVRTARVPNPKKVATTPVVPASFTEKVSDVGASTAPVIKMPKLQAPNYLEGKRVAVFSPSANGVVDALRRRGVADVRSVNAEKGLRDLEVGEWDAVLVLSVQDSRRAFMRVVDSSITPIFAKEGEKTGSVIERLNDWFGRLEDGRKNGVVKNG